MLGVDFHKSNETDRDVNTFLLSVSDDEEDYEVAMEGENTIPTPLGSGNDFMFEDGVRGRVVRLTGTNADDTWLSISEVGAGSPKALEQSLSRRLGRDIYLHGTLHESVCKLANNPKAPHCVVTREVTRILLPPSWCSI